MGTAGVTGQGIDTSIFTPHRTRAAAVSAAYRAQLPLKIILDTAGWASALTFVTYNNKPIDRDTSFITVV